MQIVIVDSSRVVLHMIAALLEPRGHTAHAFTDSAAALAFLEATPAVRVLITSLEVRPLSGLELCRSVRLPAADGRPLHVIAMSSARSGRTLAEALDSGADDYVEKPPAAEELCARLRAAERLITLQEALIRQAETDPLTGLHNRRAFFARAGAALERAGRRGQACAILADIDHFKRVNDAHGHDVGDRAIRAVADLVAPEGVAGRLGGEEFAILLPGLGLAEATARAGQIRARVRNLRVPGAHGAINLTCSFGVGAWARGEGLDALLKRADLALYAAKAAGRDRVVPRAAHDGLSAVG